MSFSNFEQNVGEKSTDLVMKGLGFLQKNRFLSGFSQKNLLPVTLRYVVCQGYVVCVLSKVLQVTNPIGFLQQKRIQFLKKNPIRPFCENRIRNIILIFFEISPKMQLFGLKTNIKSCNFSLLLFLLNRGEKEKENDIKIFQIGHPGA